MDLHVPSSPIIVTLPFRYAPKSAALPTQALLRRNPFVLVPLVQVAHNCLDINVVHDEHTDDRLSPTVTDF